MGFWPPLAQPRELTVALSFETLREFILNRMRMSHIYQPVMLKELLLKGGIASVREIATAFLARDESQLEYYEQITKRMPGKVLSNHGVVERSGDSYRLAIDPSSVSSSEREELIRLCDDAIESYLERRGSAVYDHRRSALGYYPEACDTRSLSAPDSVVTSAEFPRTRGQLRSIISFQGNMVAKTN
jgi:hypothetical protein